MAEHHSGLPLQCLTLTELNPADTMYRWLRRFFSSSDSKNPQDAPATPVTRPVPATPPPVQEIHPAPTPVPATQAKPATTPPKTPGVSVLLRHEVGANFTNWLFEECNPSDIFLNPVEEKILAAIEKIVHSRQSGADMVRRMPGVIPQLLQSLRTENFSGAELAKTISHDMVLVGAVIRLANSSMYTPTQSITSIEHAILVLGVTGLRQLITSVAFKPIIDLKSAHFTTAIAARIWDQSERCAVAGRFLAQGEPHVEPFDAFLAGLVQNAGLIAALRVLEQEFDGSQPLGSDSFCNTLVRHARILSCSIAREWRFPATVAKAVEEQGGNLKPAELSPIGKILSMADYLSKVQMLQSHGRLNPKDARLTRDLSDKERNCLQGLGRLEASA